MIIAGLMTATLPIRVGTARFRKDIVNTVSMDSNLLQFLLLSVKGPHPVSGLCLVSSTQSSQLIATSFPGSFLSREKDPGLVWSRATQTLGGNK